MKKSTSQRRFFMIRRLAQLQRLNKIYKIGRSEKKRRRFWVRPIFQQRLHAGSFHALLSELRDDREFFFRYLRMSPERFDHLVSLVQGRIEKQDTEFRKAIPVDERLALTLRFLATGESQQSLSFSFRIGRTTVSKILSETCDAIYDSLKVPHLKIPDSKEKWKTLAHSFAERWNFPHAVGAIDGKHIRIQCPKLSGTLYYNYKGYYSIVLLASCDADYNFTLFDVGSYGSNNDCGILGKSVIGQMLEINELKLPSDEELPGCDFKPLPYFFLGDDIFPLKQWLLRPYPGSQLTEKQRVYNYRHSRCRRTIENAFGILVARWRILLTPIRATVQNVEKYVVACLALHNYLLQTDNAHYTPTGFVDSESSDGQICLGEWRTLTSKNSNGIHSVRPIRGSRYKQECIVMRDKIKDYLNSDAGSVPWQLEYVRRTYKKTDS